jgi:ATP-binding cassette subfamily B protein
MHSDSRLLARFPALRRLAERHSRSIPLVRQLAASDCGPAVLAMVLGYYDKEVSLETLKETIYAGRDGSSAASLLRAGRIHGLRGRGVRIETEELDSLPAGAILHWDFGHFVVFERIRGNHVQVLDPASGRRSIPMERFRKSFTGVALVFEPGESFVTTCSHTRKTRNKISALLPQILEQRDVLVRVITASLFVQMLSAVLPLFTGILIDRVIPHQNYPLLLMLTLGFCLFQVFNTLASFVRAHLLIYLRTQLEASWTLRFLDHLIDLSYEFFQQHTSGDLMVRLGSYNTVREILTSTVLSAILDGSMAMIYFGLLVIVSVRLTVIVVLLAVARLALLWIMRWKQRQLVAETLQNQSRLQTYEVEMLSAIETLKAMGVEHKAAERWSHLFVDGLNISIRQSRLTAVFNAVLNLLATTTSLVVLFYASLLVLRGSLTLGTMIAFGALAGGLLGPLSNLVNGVVQLQTVEVYLERLQDVVSRKPEQDASTTLIAGRLKGAIALEDVSFRYASQGSLVVDNVSVQLEPGMRVAIVGRTGCGKSTLARLLAGLYVPISGRILFDGQDLRSLELRSVRAQLGIVTQETHLFSGSIRQNIALTDPQMSLEQVVRAAKIAGIHDEVMGMPMGYNTILADRGLSLSGGQRQRLAIARALARSPRVLILDEATSHLDAVTEDAICNNLRSLRCTQVVIAHRLSTVRNADLILVLEEGQLVEQGTHNSLLSRDNLYTTLVGAQRDQEACVRESA